MAEMMYVGLTGVEAGEVIVSLADVLAVEDRYTQDVRAGVVVKTVIVGSRVHLRSGAYVDVRESANAYAALAAQAFGLTLEGR